MAQTIVWFEIPVLDIKRAAQFYQKVLDKKMEVANMEGMDYAMFDHSGPDMIGGTLFVQADKKPSLEGPLLYFNTNGRLEAALAEVTQNGGKIETPAHSLGSFGYRAVIHDSEGNRLALHSETL